MIPFDYPAAKTRRHGPQGYKSYEYYRSWLRDEFRFRCVYCLAREQWGRVTGEFDIDHFLPQARRPGEPPVYENLLYVCRGCNLLKADRLLPDPVTALSPETVVVKARRPAAARQVAQEQPTPEERIAQIDRQQVDQDQAHRDLAAKHWRWARSQLAQVSETIRNEIVERWNQSWLPADAHYFADFVRRELRSRGLL